jgi:hypothetical protein
MGGAFLALYTVTAERPWLAAPKRPPISSTRNFARRSASPPPRPLPRPRCRRGPRWMKTSRSPLRQHARALHRQEHLSRNGRPRDALPGVAHGGEATGLLRQRHPAGQPGAATEPIHITIVGAKDDPAARALFAAALRDAPPYTRLEWYDRATARSRTPMSSIPPCPRPRHSSAQTAPVPPRSHTRTRWRGSWHAGVAKWQTQRT